MAINRMKGRRSAIEQTRVQSRRRTVDEVQLDPELFQPSSSMDWFGQPHRTMVIFQNSRFAWFVTALIVFFAVFFITTVIILGLVP